MPAYYPPECENDQPGYVIYTPVLGAGIGVEVEGSGASGIAVGVSVGVGVKVGVTRSIGAETVGEWLSSPK